MHRLLRRLAPLAVLSTLFACGDTSGEAGTAIVGVDCDPNDEGCAAQGLYAPIARGASVIVDASTYVGGEELDLHSVNADVIATDGLRVAALGSGYSALLFTSPSDGRIVDFINVEVQEADRLVAVRTDLGDARRPIEGRISLYVGEEMRVILEPHRAAHTLIGDVEGDWNATQSPEDTEGEGDSVDVIGLLGTGVLTERRIVAREPGTARVDIDALDLSTSFEVEVLP